MANIKVAVRVRPISEREIHFTGSEVVVHTEAKAISLTNLKVPSSKAGDSRERIRRYGFDYCFDSSDPGDEKYASQAKIYETLGESILDVLFNGYNSCLVAYGQSASGKTYTMMGSKEDPGLTPRVCEGLFLRLANEEKSDTNFTVSVSYLEVYNERVRDLLKPSSNSTGLKVREHPRLGPYVQGLTHHPVLTLGSLISRVEEGTRARKTASTLQNPTSSRSHALLTLTLRPSTSNIGQSGKDTATESRNFSGGNDHFPRGSKLHLVDLAGSESAAACGGINRLKEGANINKSLVALGNVISALAERGGTGSSPGRRFIPYRDSALTWLLKDALGGNATTIMLATISPASGSYNETSHTLRFAQRAQSVVNRPVINEDPVSRVIKELRAEIARLKTLLVEKNVNPDCKSICVCQSDRERKIEIQSHESPAIVESEHEEEKSEDEHDCDVSKAEKCLSIPERRHSTSEEFVFREKSASPVRKFSCFEIVHELKTSSLESIEANNYSRAEVSEVIIDDEVQEPAFVDIPTLVAVLIKPDDNIQAGAHQIEEISSDGVPEDIDAEFSENLDSHFSSECKAKENFGTIQTPVEDTSRLEISDDHKFIRKNSLSSGESTINRRGKGKLQKHGSIDSDLLSKSSLNLQSLKKYGSIENLTKKRDVAYAFQRSQTNLDKRNGSLDKLKKLNNIKEVEDQRSGKSNNSWRSFGSWPSRDFQRKGSNDSDKSLRESAFLGRSKNQTRKQSIDGLKRKSSKDSSSSSSKDELLTSGGQPRDRFSRKGSLDHEQLTPRTHTPIQRTRRAEIVAAVTERLYSTKKPLEDTVPAGIASSTPGNEVRSLENADVKLASATRMRLQEISRKMLAKRRRICVDTQTDIHQTRRVRDAASITEEPKIITRDASILTDRHDDYETIPSVDNPVRRVKEIATCTDSDLRQAVIRCKDAANVTEEYYEDFGTIGSSRNDSGIMSDDTQTYAESNLSSTEISDLSPIGRGRSVELVENSTSMTISSGAPNSGSQTRREDLAPARCSSCDSRCCGVTRHCQGNYGIDHPVINQTCHHNDRNVISISLPEMVNITIETSNGMESKIKVFDGDETIDDRAIVSMKNNTVQTDEKDFTEVGTTTDDINSGQIYFHNFSTSTKPTTGQPDGKTFRIENIFHDSSGASRITPTVEIVRSSSGDAATTNSLIVTNSIGTSFVPETRENATEMGGGRFSNSLSFLGATGCMSLATDDFTKNAEPLTSFNPNFSRQNICQDYSIHFENQRLLSNIPTVNSGTKHNKTKCYCRKEEDSTGSGLNKTNHDLPDKSKLGTSKTNGVNVSIDELTSPPIIAMLNRRICTEQDPNFSDDSLDLAEGGLDNDNKNNALVIEQSNNLEVPGITTNEKVCPPDLVAHTKKDINDIFIPNTNLIEKFEDFDDESQQIEFPKIQIDSTTKPSFVTSVRNLKTLILGDPCYTVNHAEDSDLTDFQNQSSMDPLIDNEDHCYSTIDVVEDMDTCLVSDGRSFAPKSIIKKPTQYGKNPRVLAKCQSKCGTLDLENKNSCRKRVRFSIPEVNCTTSSDSEACENLASDEESVKQVPRTILEEYLDEAVVFMRNMNSINEYMSSACTSDRRTTKSHNRRRGKGKSINYIEYEGRRINLDDEVDKSEESEDDGDLDFNVESYDKCLKSMDRLEECLARVKRHDEALRANYGIGKNGSTGAKLDLAKFSIDSNVWNNDPNDEHTVDDTRLRRNSNDNDVRNREIDDGNNNLQLFQEDEEDTIYDSVLVHSRNVKKPQSRRLSRFSDLRKYNPSTYSQLRNKYASQAIDLRSDKKKDTFHSVANAEATAVDGCRDGIVSDDHKTPDCRFILPKITKDDETPYERLKKSIPRQRFSLSKYDSSNESSSSNEALATFMESIDKAARSRDKIQYPGSPRARFLQLLTERRRIVENTRSTGAS